MLQDGPVMVRKTLTGHSGDGIIYCTQLDQLVAAPLYVQYIKKYSEFRVHCIRTPDAGEYKFFVQRKARKKDVPDDQVNWKVRNIDGGFIYANDPANVGEYPEELLNQAGLAMTCSGLTFGAVDIIYNKAQKKCYVLEINTAPGLTGRTIQFYADNLKALTDAA
jgi:D-alanine-D-alanine ligase-like ATP-grasp enzyme